MGEKIALLFQCNFVGIDIIYDEIDQVYRFMEINTLPMRVGFESVYPEIVVTDEVMLLCRRLYESKKNILSIKNNYIHNIARLAHNTSLHFCDRLDLLNNTDNKDIQDIADKVIATREQLSLSIARLQKKHIPKTVNTDIINHKQLRYNLMSESYPKL